MTPATPTDDSKPVVLASPTTEVTTPRIQIPPSSADFVIHRAAKRLAFGSCHKLKYGDSNLWNIISKQSPDAFLWTGDAIYPPVRDIASLELLSQEYESMLTNHTVAYGSFQSTVPDIFGVYDDHDYGGNDRGHEMPDKNKRAELFWKFLNATRKYPTDHRGQQRQGLYYSVVWNGGNDKDLTTKVIFLDTRWHRQDHCIPSVAGRFPLGAGIACLTRWLSAGAIAPRLCNFPKHAMLGRDQWDWFERQLQEPVDALVIVSSVQVLTTNPAMESWGHFPEERARLLDLLMKHRARNNATVILSGDVHHAEILDPLSNQGFPLVEVTSSGLTHTCQKHIYGAMCEPLLKTFNTHRSSGPNYYLGRNFGTIEIGDSSLTVNVHDAVNGTIVLHTGAMSTIPRTVPFNASKLCNVPDCMDRHLLPYFSSILLGALLIAWIRFRRDRMEWN